MDDMIMVLIHAEDRNDRLHGIVSGTQVGEGWRDDRGVELHDDDGGTYSAFSARN